MTTRSDERPTARSWGILRYVFSFEETGILLAVGLFVGVGAASSPYFLTLNNLTGILQNITFLGFLSVGVGLTLMARPLCHRHLPKFDRALGSFAKLDAGRVGFGADCRDDPNMARQRERS